MSAIDPSAFAEWIVAKAEKHGAVVSEENLRVAREAVEGALARDGDEVHVACALAGAAGPVQIDERMTRTAVEVLFPKVAMSHPPPALVAPKPKRPEPKRKEAPPLEEEEPTDASRTKRTAVVIALVVLAFASGVAVASALAKEHDDHPSDTHEKREARH